MNSIADECIALIAKQKSIPPDQIRLDSTFDELALDSLDRVSLAFDIEEKYEIEIPEDKLGQIKTVNDMVTGIEDAASPEAAPLPKPAHDAGCHHRGRLHHAHRAGCGQLCRKPFRRPQRNSRDGGSPRGPALFARRNRGRFSSSRSG